MAVQSPADARDAARIGADLERELQDRGISVAEAAAEAGCSTNTLRRMFKGRGLDIVRVIRLERAYGFSLAGSAPRPAASSAADVDVVEVPILPIRASAGTGLTLDESDEAHETVPLPVRWLRRFGTPTRLKLVEIVGGSMTPPLEDGDWVLINLDRTELREGIAVVRYDDAYFIKRVQPEGRKVRLTSSADGYEPRVIDLGIDPNAFEVVGYAEGRWRARGLA